MNTGNFGGRFRRKPQVHETMFNVILHALEVQFGVNNVYPGLDKETIRIKSVSTNVVHKLTIERV